MAHSTRWSLWKAERLSEPGKITKPALLNAEMVWNRLCHAAVGASYLNASRAKSTTKPTTCAPTAKRTT